jgi:hypothetical protein
MLTLLGSLTSGLLSLDITRLLISRSQLALLWHQLPNEEPPGLHAFELLELAVVGLHRAVANHD